MLKELLQYIQDETKAEVVEIAGRKYTTRPVEKVLDASPASLGIATLTGLVDYCKANVDACELPKLIVHVEDEGNVKLLSALHGDFAQRDTLLHIKADLLKMPFNSWVEAEAFNIAMQSLFVDSPDRAAVLKVIGNIRENAVKDTSDDGVSQEVVAKVGIGRVGNAKVPNPVTLKPYRTFAEVDQPASQFVFRMRSGANGPECMLVEADGGAWRNLARQNIKDYLVKALPTGMTVIA